MNWLEQHMNSIVLGDSYELIKNIPDKSIDCIYTDIPYEIMDGGKGGSSFGKRMHQLRYEQLEDIRNGIDNSILHEFARVMKKINCFIWCSKAQILDILKYFDQYDCTFEILTWCKTNPSPCTNGVWLPDTEYCLYFREKGVSLNEGYELKSRFYVSSINKHDKALYKHPTIKPSDLVRRHLLHTTQTDDIVFDPFSGSGTTSKNAKELGRKFLGIEINEKWHKISVDRLNGITASGQTSIFTDFGMEDL